MAVSDDHVDPNLYYEVGKLNILPHHDPSFEANTEAFLDLLVCGRYIFVNPSNFLAFLFFFSPFFW